MNGLFAVAKAIYGDPGKLNDLVMSDNIEHSGLWDKGNERSVERVNFLELYQRFQHWLTGEALEPGRPLNPIRTRIRQYLGTAAPIRRGEKNAMDIEVEFTLGDRPTPSPPGNPERIARNPDLTRDKVLLIGTYAEFLDKLYHLSYVEVLANIRSYLRFAERCHPEIAGMIYGRIHFVVKDAGVPPLVAVELAHSLLKSGYAKDGAELLDEAVANLDPIRDLDIEWNEILLDLHRAGRHEAVSKILAKLEEGRELLLGEYRDQMTRVFNDHVWWRRGGQVKMKGVINNHPFGVPDALMYEMVYAFQYHRGKRRQYMRYKGFVEETMKGHPNRISLDNAIDAFGAEKCRRYYQAREAALLSDLYNVQREYLDKLRRGPQALFYIADQIQRDEMAGRDEALTYLAPHFDRWKGNIAAAERTEFKWYREVSGVPFSRRDGIDSGMREIYGAFSRRNTPQYEVQSKHGQFSTAFVDDIEGDLLYDEAVYLKTAMSLPGRFRAALTAVKKMPVGTTKAALLEYAAQVMPDDMRPGEIKSFVDAWNKTVEEVTGSLPDWNYVESGQMRSRFKREAPIGVPSSAERSHFYLRSMRKMAEFLLSMDDGGYQAQGRQIVESLSYDSQFTYSVHNTASIYSLTIHQPDPKVVISFSSAVEVAKAWNVLASDHRKKGDRGDARESTVRAAKVLLDQRIEHVPDVGHQASEFINTAMEVLENLSRYGEAKLAEELYVKCDKLVRMTSHYVKSWHPAVREWQNSKTELFELLTQDMRLYDLAVWNWKDMQGVNYRDEGKVWQDKRQVQMEKVVQTERDLLSVGVVCVAAAVLGDEGRRDGAIQRVERLLESVEEDIHQRNEFFPVSSLIRSAEVLAANPVLYSQAVRMYNLAIRALELSRGSDEKFEQNVWSISKSIDESGLDAVQAGTQDDIFTELVERLFPESRMDVWVSESAFSILTGHSETPGIFDYVLREERYPKAEARLVKKAAKVRELVRFDRNDTPEMHAKKLFILREFFVRLSSHGEILSAREAIKKVVADAPAEVITAFNEMFPEKVTDIGDQVEGYPTFEAIRRGEFDMDQAVATVEKDLAEIFTAGEMNDRARAVFAAVNALLTTDLSVGRTEATLKGLEGRRIFKAILPHIRDYVTGKKDHQPTALERTLVKTLWDDDDLENAQVKASLYLTFMRQENAPVEVKDSSFDGLYRSGEVTVYVYEAMKKRMAEVSTPGERTEWYDRWLYWNEKTGRKDDFSQSLYLEMPEAEAAGLFEYLGKTWYRMKEIYYGVTRRVKPKKLDALDPIVIELYMFDELVTAEDKRRAEAGIAIGGEGHVHSYAERWDQLTAEVGYVLAYHAATNIEGARDRFKGMMKSGCDQVVHGLESTNMSMFYVSIYDIQG